MSRRLILGSQSPRRKEILSFFTLPFVQIPSAFDEESVAFNGDPKEYVELLSSKKAEALASRFPQDLILTADTVVYLAGKIYNKPRDRQEAVHMLRSLSGNWHHVLTGVTVRNEDHVFSASEESKILFQKLTPEQIHSYLDTAAFLDKAGGYAIQGAGSILVSRVEGCYYNVVGLPVNTLKDLLLKVGIDLWKYL
jgi:septum formation protein